MNWNPTPTAHRKLVQHALAQIQQFDEQEIPGVLPHNGQPHNAARCSRCQAQKHLTAIITLTKQALEHDLIHALRAQQESPLETDMTDLAWMDVVLNSTGAYILDRRLSQAAQERIETLLKEVPLTEAELAAQVATAAPQENLDLDEQNETRDSPLGSYQGISSMYSSRRVDTQFAVDLYVRAYRKAVQQQYGGTHS